KTTALQKALTGLVFENQATVDALEIHGLTEAEYTTESFGFLTTALALPETTHAEIVAKITAINTAKEGLVFKTQAALETEKTTANAKVEVEYTAATYKALADALKLPEVTNANVTAKTTALQKALTGLVFENQAALDEAKLNTGLVSTHYTTASWKVLTDLTGNTNNETTYALINTKIAAIKDAKTALVFDNADELSTLKNTLSALIETDYTAASWKEYITMSNTTNNIPETAYNLIAMKITQLTDAQGKLVKKDLVLTELQTLVDAQYNIVEQVKTLKITNADGKYTAETYTVYTTALTAAETAITNSMLQSEVDAKTTALQLAINNLKLTV
ncbi:MAG: hypothetical protein RSB71_03630, partial [Bacilli bacterium]